MAGGGRREQATKRRTGAAQKEKIGGTASRNQRNRTWRTSEGGREGGDRAVASDRGRLQPRAADGGGREGAEWLKREGRDGTVVGQRGARARERGNQKEQRVGEEGAQRLSQQGWGFSCDTSYSLLFFVRRCTLARRARRRMQPGEAGEASSRDEHSGAGRISVRAAPSNGSAATDEIGAAWFPFWAALSEPCTCLFSCSLDHTQCRSVGCCTLTVSAECGRGIK